MIRRLLARYCYAEAALWARLGYPNCAAWSAQVADWVEVDRKAFEGKAARGGSGTYMDDGIDMFPAGKKEAGNMIYTEFYEEFPWQAERESVDLDGDWPFMIHRA